MTLGRVSVVLICGLAFLLASTPARNSDLWLHLASGRELSAGRLLDGTEPFSSTTQGVFWVNHSWLSDFLLYQIYKLGDGAALIVVKAVLTTLLAALLLGFRRRGEGMGGVACASLVALLALGPWLLPLQSNLWSLLGVVLTLYLLERTCLTEDAPVPRARPECWLLVPLFALWANLDEWFVLGPVLVGLYALGELLHRSPASGGVTPPARRLLLLFCVGLAACLATPYHYRIFAWPTFLGLNLAEQALQYDPLGPSMIFPSFGGYFTGSPLFRSPGAWAYYFLLLAGAVSFMLALRTWHLGRLLVWLALAALSLYRARTIPFFAVAAAPLLALNVQQGRDQLALRGEPILAKRVPDLVRWMGVLLGVVLLVLAWPGWLQPAPYQPRGWAVEPDGSLVRMAEQLKRQHAEGRFRADRFALTFSPEVAHYLAWFCPEEKGFVDSRWPLFDRVADDYVRMRRCLLQKEGDVARELVPLLDAYRLDRIVLYDADWSRLAQAYRHLFRAVDPLTTEPMPRQAMEWELRAVEGGATLFCRRSGTASSPPPFQYRRAAYLSEPDQHVPPAPRPPQPSNWLDVFRCRLDPGSADREEAALHLLSSDVQAEELNAQWLLSQAAGLVGCGVAQGTITTAAALAMRLQITPPLPLLPSEPLLLAVRAARRALAANPDDARAFLLLGEAYFRLARQTQEATWQALLPPLASLRQAQILTALEQAATLRPDLDQAHALLAQLYLEQGQMDRCLDHLEARLRIVKHPDVVAAVRGEVDKLEKVVSESERTYQANLVGKTNPSKALDRAQLASRYGLSRKALQILQESSPVIFGRAGVEYQLDLMIKAGQSYEVVDVLKPELEFKINHYHWLKAVAAASCGDYAEADTELDKGSERLRRIGLSPKLVVPVRVGMAFHVGRAVLSFPLKTAGVAEWVTALRSQVKTLDSLVAAAELLREEADWQVLRGLLALEAGEVAKAGQHFHAALDVWRSQTATVAGAGLDFPARPIAQEMLHRMQE